MDEVHKARLLKFDASSAEDLTEGASSSVGTDNSASNMTHNHKPSIALPLEAYEALCNLLTTLQNMIQELPEAISKALASAPHAPPHAQALASAPHAPPQAEVVSAPAKAVKQAAYGVNGADEGAYMCGVCHTEISLKPFVWAYDPCGHFPFCSPCIDELRSTSQDKACPYCTSNGTAASVRLHDD